MARNELEKLFSSEHAHVQPSPVLSGLMPAEGAYGDADPRNLIAGALKKNSYIVPRPQVVSLLGPPGVGKSTLLGEEVVLAMNYFTLKSAHSPYRILSPKDHISVVAIEDSQQLTAQEKIFRDEDEKSDATKKFYELSNRKASEQIQTELEKRRIVFFETPGMIQRGDSIVKDIALRQNGFERFDYDDSYYLLTGGVESVTAQVRASFLLDPTARADALEEVGIRVHLEEQTASLGGGDINAVLRFETSLAGYFRDLVSEGIDFHKFFSYLLDRHPNLFDHAADRAAYLELAYSRFWLGETLQIPEEKVFTGRNTHLSEVHLHQGNINAYNPQFAMLNATR